MNTQENTQENTQKNIVIEEKSPIENSQNFKTAKVAILGRPNAGKSTLLNSLIDVSLSATSPRPQTTRSNVRAILQHYDSKKNWDGQLILLDTPGVNFKKGLLERSMYMSIEGALRDADIVIWVADFRGFSKDLRDIEMNRPGSDKMAAFLKDRLQNKDTAKWILALSKVDMSNKVELLPLIERVQKAIPEFSQIVPIASILGTSNGSSNLDSLVSVLHELAPVLPPVYSEEDWTDLNEKKLIQNLIRETVFRMAREEVPYQTDCTIMRFQEPEGDKKMKEVDARIWVSKDSLKPILVGKQGQMIRDIGSTVRKRFKEITGDEIVLRLMVKVVDKWETRASSLEELGYDTAV